MLPTGATIGILGGGQLGRMLALAAARLGLRSHIYEPAENSPAFQVCDQITCAAWDDKAALEAFARSVDVVTFEFENIPTETLDLIETITPIHPNRRALATSQDRLSEKTFLNDLGLKTAPFADIDSLSDLEKMAGQNGILKTRRFGYDGKGQQRISPDSNLSAAYAALEGAPAIFEGFVDFSLEISVIAARSQDGHVAVFDPSHNIHEDGILRKSTVPAPVPTSLATDAVLLAGRVLNALDYVGVMGVELFVTKDGLIVNEFAPRVHNSGHWTQAACTICQFEQHIRAVAGWPLGDGQRHSNAEMDNLIGEDVADIAALSAQPGQLHLYGKAEMRAGRKMGHIIRVIGPKS